MEHTEIKAIAFDLDHTLFDRYSTLRSIAYLLKQHYADRLNPALSAARLGDMLVETDKAHIYDGWPFMFETLVGQGMFVSAPAFEEYFAFFMDAFQKIAIPFPTAKEMLAGLRKKGYKVGLLTNGVSKAQWGKVKLLGLENSFDVIFAGEEMGIQKPNVQPFQKMAACLGCSPEQMVYVGDHPRNDVDASRRAGCIPVWVKTAGRDWSFPDYEKPRFEINDVLELPALLARIDPISMKKER